MSDRVGGYARGLFEIAAGEGQLERVQNELSQIAAAFSDNTELRSALTDPALPTDRKEGIVRDLLGGRASDVTLSALTMLVGSGRIGELPAIVRGLVQASAASRSREVAEIRSAVALDDATVSRLEAALSKATGTDVEARVIVDPSVIGGLVATVGDRVIDGSVHSRLESVRTALGS